MNNQKRVLATFSMLAFSLAAGAQEIYQRTSKDGVLEFSDRPFADGTQIEVRPNVVTTNPVARRQRAPAAAADSAEAAPAASPPRQMRSDDNTNYVRANRRARAGREARENRREQRNYRDEEPSTNPNPGQATRNAARAAAQRPGRR